MAFPNTFASRTGAIPTPDLDENFDALEDPSSASTGAALIGFSNANAYPVGTVGFVLRRMVVAEAFAQGGDTSDAQAFQRAIDHCAGLGGGVVQTFKTAIAFDDDVILKTAVKVCGLGRGKSVITKSAHTFSAFTDNNTLADGAEVHGFTIRCATAPTAGETDRGILIDASSSSARYRFSDLLFENMFRGLNVHQAGVVEYDNVDGSALLDSTIYIGEIAANRTGSVKMGRSTSTSSFTANPGGGGGVVVLAYVDDVSPGYTRVASCGPSSGAVNLYHGLYLRACGSSDAGYVKASSHKRGAALHVYSDTGGGEPACGDTVATVVCDTASNYCGVRVDGCQKFVLRAASKISACALQGVYVSNCTMVMLEAGVRVLNCNGDAVTSAEGSAAVLVDTVTDFIADGVIAVDDTSTAGQYGQGTAFCFKGAVQYKLDKCRHVFPTGAVGYYFVSHESGSTVTYPAISNCYQSGPQSFLNEGGTVVPQGQGVVENHTRASSSTSPLMSVEQLHRWRLRDCWNEGSRFDYESDGKNVVFWGSDHPASNTWAVGDRWIRSAPAAGGVTGGRCVTAGTPGTWKYESSLAA